MPGWPNKSWIEGPGDSTVRLMNLPSEVLNTPMKGLVPTAWPPPGIRFSNGSLSSSIATSTEQAVAQMPDESSDTSTSVASPVRSRWNNAAAMRSEEHTSELQSLMRHTDALF